MRQINEIIIHCTATPAGRPVTVADITRWHKEKGWKTIGYHYVIYLDGSIHEGRKVSQVGAHCEGHNATSIGVVYVGGLTADGKHAADTRTPQQKSAMERLVSQLKQTYKIENVHGHNEYANKSCPSFDVRGWRKEVGL